MCETVFPSKPRSSVCWQGLRRSLGLLSATKEGISGGLAGSVSASWQELPAPVEFWTPSPRPWEQTTTVLTAQQEWDPCFEGACYSAPWHHILCLEENPGAWAGWEHQGALLGPLVWVAGIAAWVYGVHSRTKQLCGGVDEPPRFSKAECCLCKCNSQC